MVWLAPLLQFIYGETATVASCIPACNMQLRNHLQHALTVITEIDVLML